MAGELQRRAAEFRRDLLALERSAASDMVRAYGTSWTRVERRVTVLWQEVTALREAGQDVPPVRLMQLDRYLRLQDEITGELRRFAQYADQSVTATQLAAVNMAQQHAPRLISAVATDADLAGLEQFVDFAHAPRGAIEALVGYARGNTPLGVLLDAIPNQVNGTVRDTLIAGLALGQNPRETARQVRRAYGTGLARALNISRTECLPGDTIIDSAVIEAIYRRWYEGAMIEIVTESGRHFSATPNHPMLTQRGWVAAGEIISGDNLICNTGQQHSCSAGNKDIQGRPTTLSKIFDSLSAVGISERRRGGKPDFHGDGMQGDIDILYPLRPLSIGSFTPIYEPLVKQFLAPTDPARAAICNSCGRLLSFDKQPCLCIRTDWNSHFFEPPLDSSMTNLQVFSNSGLGFTRQITSSDLLQVNIGSESLISNGLVAGFDSIFGREPTYTRTSNNFADNGFMGVEPLGNLFHSHTGTIEFDHVISVSLRPWRGHVYNLSTPYGYFTANQLYTGNTLRAYREATRLDYQANDDILEGWVWSSALDRRTCITCWALSGRVFKLNRQMPAHPGCRCSLSPMLKKAYRGNYEPTAGAVLFNQAGPEVQRAVLGPGAYQEFQAGRVGIENFVTFRRSRDWGITVQRASLGEAINRARGA